MPCSNRSRDIAPPILDTWATKGGQRNALVVLTPVKGPIYMVQEAGWTSRSVWMGPENLNPIGIRNADCPARS